MSNGLHSWNPISSRSWADMLGLVNVPLFSPGEMPSFEGEAAVLQDGVRASFAFLSGEGSWREFSNEEPLSWSWSADVRHLLIVDPSIDRMFLRRWDEPGEFRQYKIPTRGLGAEELLSRIESAPDPKTPDVVRYVLHGFRLIRQSVPSDQPLDSLRILNGFLLLAQAVKKRGLNRNDVLRATTFAQAMALLDNVERTLAKIDDMRPDLLERPTGLLATHFLDRERRSGCQLYSSLLFRHAISKLYQEAHLQIEQEPQGYFPGMGPASAPVGPLGKDVRYTPVNLARGMVEEALAALGDRRARDRPLIVLDPASGSGVFQQECLRELAREEDRGTVRLEAYDISDIANYITEFSLAQTKDDIEGGRGIEIVVRPGDSLRINWEHADLILMNPPFIPWKGMQLEQREAVEDCLGDHFRGQPDMALAFLHKAAASLKPGGVLAIVLPSALLDTESGKRVREQISESADIIAIGKFEGYTYFETSFLEPAFIVLRKRVSEDEPTPPAKIIIAQEGAEDRALRILRLAEQGEQRQDEQVEIFSVAPSYLQEGSWLPQRKAVYELRGTLERLRLTKIGELFTVNQGVRTGDNAAFILSSDQLEGLPEGERAFFRPIAGQGTLRYGRLGYGFHLFYPYNSEGSVIASVEELRERMPEYFNRWLREREDKLSKRSSISEWWLPARPRSWQLERVYKLASTYFGASGSFAYDDTGDYVVVQGYAWFWRAKVAPKEPHDLQATLHSTPLPWAYVALLNSPLFERVLSAYCPKVQGGQFNLSNRFVKDIPLPNLGDRRFPTDLLNELESLGRRIYEGGYERVLDEADRAAQRAYGLTKGH